MKLLVKAVGISVLSSIILFAGDYSSMSTEDMMHMRGNVAVEKRDAFRTEMLKRMKNMSVEEKQKFKSKYGQGRMMSQMMMGDTQVMKQNRMMSQGRMMMSQGQIMMNNGQMMRNSKQMNKTQRVRRIQMMMNNGQMMKNNGQKGKKRILLYMIVLII